MDTKINFALDTKIKLATLVIVTPGTPNGWALNFSLSKDSRLGSRSSRGPTTQAYKLLGSTPSPGARKKGDDGRWSIDTRVPGDARQGWRCTLCFVRKRFASSAQHGPLAKLEKASDRNSDYTSSSLSTRSFRRSTTQAYKISRFES